MLYNDEPNLVTVTKMNMIDKMSCSGGALRTIGARILYQVSHSAFAEVSVAFEVSCELLLRSQLLSKSPADLWRDLRSSKG